MPLSAYEKGIIARRAAGEYGIVPVVRRIANDHSKNRSLEDQVFLEFARLVSKQSWAWEDYERLQRAVLAIMPDPWGDSVIHVEPAVEVEPKKRRKAPRKEGDGNKPPGKPLPAAGILDLLSSWSD